MYEKMMGALLSKKIYFNLFGAFTIGLLLLRDELSLF